MTARNSGRSPAVLLEEATFALARASRCREALELAEAQKAYADVVAIIAEYDGRPKEEVAFTTTERRIVEAERLLVEAILYAHKRGPKENLKYFSMAATVAAPVSPLVYARAQCCLGCTQIFEGAPDNAITLLESARETFGAHGRRDEKAQATYHLARAYIADNQSAVAVQLLEGMFPEAETTLRSFTRYELAALTLLAVQYKRLRRSKDARKLLRFATRMMQASGLHTTHEGRAIKFISRWGFRVYMIWPSRADLPLV